MTNFIFHIRVGSKFTSKTENFRVIDSDPERAIAVACRLAEKSFPNDDSLCAVELHVNFGDKRDKTLN